MTQLFRIGGIYWNGNGDGPWEITSEPASREGAFAIRSASTGTNIPSGWFLNSGEYVRDAGRPSCMHLIPGELHQVDGAWVPITEQPMSVYFADAQESEWVSLGCTKGDHPADLAMIARDGIAAPKPAVVALPAAPTAHKAIAGLTFLGAVDHRLGARVVHGS
jgi:hypothetical protein